MEKAGKVLVLVNVGFSCMLAAAAGVLLYNHINWTNTKGQGGQPDGELVKRKERLDEFQGSVKPSELAWRAARTDLAAKEEGRKLNQAWFAAELARLYVENPMDKRAVLQIEFTGDKDAKPTGFYVPDPNNRGLPKLVDVKDRYGNPLHPLAFYQQAEEPIHKNLVKELADLDAAKKRDARLTVELMGRKALEKAKADLAANPKNQDAQKVLEVIGNEVKIDKGLIDRIEEEKAKREDLVEEQKLLEPLLVNTYVETQLILMRKKALEDRVKELEAGKASK
jgi:hypothetical protein